MIKHPSSQLHSLSPPCLHRPSEGYHRAAPLPKMPPVRKASVLCLCTNTPSACPRGSLEFSGGFHSCFLCASVAVFASLAGEYLILCLDTYPPHKQLCESLKGDRLLNNIMLDKHECLECYMESWELWVTDKMHSRNFQ